MKDSKIYFVYRYYSSSDTTVFYGWTGSKPVTEAFFQQRSKKKYKMAKFYTEELNEKFPDYAEVYNLKETEIDYVKLLSACTGREVIFFTTQNEMRDTEIKIQQHYSELSSFSESDTFTKIHLQNFMNLKPRYFYALIEIGFRPEQLDQLFPSASEKDNFNNEYDIEEQINDAYDGYTYNVEYLDEANGNARLHELIGISVLNDVARKVIYSFENFVRMLKEDL